MIIGISGASGVIYGIRLLETLAQDKSIETHLVLSPAAKATITQETDWKVSAVEALADVVHKPGDIGASIASGSFDTMGMIVAPCSIKSLSAIANSYDADPYAIFGATVGYNAPKGDWQTWLDLRNLTDKHYAATVTPGYDDKGLDAARSTPGEGMAMYVGVSWSLL